MASKSGLGPKSLITLRAASLEGLSANCGLLDANREPKRCQKKPKKLATATENPL